MIRCLRFDEPEQQKEEPRKATGGPPRAGLELRHAYYLRSTLCSPGRCLEFTNTGFGYAPLGDTTVPMRLLPWKFCDYMTAHESVPVSPQTLQFTSCLLCFSFDFVCVVLLVTQTANILNIVSGCLVLRLLLPS